MIDLSLIDLVLAVFIATYLGMAFGRWPGLAIDRTGIALIGAIVLVAAGALTLEGAAQSVDLPTLLLLFGLMIVSAQFAASGFYDGVAARVARMGGSPKKLLAGVIAAAVLGVACTLLHVNVAARAMAFAVT